ncbi:hypothetical protein [Sphingosinicella sp. BN140058]|uniref:hypothetical protein n=1 Tax=Sphingosinicella sp. BN140058 TaxID=1892855 RepID=UPI0013ED015E|nr:hypothetical protein [Sphingosinicella sp. BN140058]
MRITEYRSFVDALMRPALTGYSLAVAQPTLAPEHDDDGPCAGCGEPDCDFDCDGPYDE